MESIFEKLGGRKFVLTLVVLLVGGLVEAFGKNGLSANFVALLLGSSTIFGVANAAVTMNAGGQVDVSGATTGDEANTKADELATSQEQLRGEVAGALNELEARMAQIRSEVDVQAQGLALATKLLKTNMKIGS